MLKIQVLELGKLRLSRFGLYCQLYNFNLFKKIASVSPPGSGAALCLFNKVTHRAQAEVLRRISRLVSSLRLSLAKATQQQVQALQPVVSSPIRSVWVNISITLSD